jgi:hypothetical protein
MKGITALLAIFAFCIFSSLPASPQEKPATYKELLMSHGEFPPLS